MSMFRILLISSVTLVHAYVLWRVAWVRFFRRRFSGRQMTAAAIVLWAVLVAGGLSSHGHDGFPFLCLEWLGMTWMGALLLFATPMIVVDLATGFGLLFRRPAARLRGYALIVGGLLCVIALIQGHRSPVISHHEIQIPDLPREMDGTVIAVLSDLHIGSFLGEKWLNERASQIDAFHPDLVVLVGDMLEGHSLLRHQDRLADAFGRLSAPLGVWAVYGNHEFYDESHAAGAILQKAGIEVLHNRWVEIAPGLVLAGVDDLTIHKRSGRVDDPVKTALAGRPAGAVILLSHTPWEVEKAAAMGVGLMLSGHTHGGQIWPFDLLTRRVYPFVEGRYDIGPMALIVCRGTGTWGPRMRFWLPDEILAIRLRATGRPMDGES
ncbi:MAG: metallophosphoesterase [Thermodesulfobacteriota bacterium]